VSPATVVVASAADAAYAIPLTVMLRSLLDRLSPRYMLDAHVVDGGLGDLLRTRVEASLPPERVRVRWHLPDARRLDALPLWGRMTAATYYKLLIPDVVPASVSKLLWLDADVLAVDDVAALWETDVDGLPLRAARDSVITGVGDRFGVAGWRELGLPAAAPYFNAGVMLSNLDWWRAHDVTGCAFAYVRRHWRHVYFFDQDGLNAVLATRWGPLDPAWNWSPSFGAACVAPRLIHFLGKLKPWRYSGRSRWHAMYYAALDRTAWAGWRPPRSLAAWASGVVRRPVRRRLRRLEQWHMALIRRRTLRLTERREPQAAVERNVVPRPVED
jgi:lipopolysaccharide biosynthesis glycosyltransferase